MCAPCRAGNLQSEFNPEALLATAFACKVKLLAAEKVGVYHFQSEQRMVWVSRAQEQHLHISNLGHAGRQEMHRLAKLVRALPLSKSLGDCGLGLDTVEQEECA